MKRDLPTIADDEIDRIALAQARAFDGIRIWDSLEDARAISGGFYHRNRGRIYRRLDLLARQGKLRKDANGWYWPCPQSALKSSHESR